MDTFGLPEAYIKMHKWVTDPAIIPISGLTNKPIKNVSVNGMISISEKERKLLLMGLIKVTEILAGSQRENMLS